MYVVYIVYCQYCCAFGGPTIFGPSADRVLMLHTSA